jgi:hypothetical protein
MLLATRPPERADRHGILEPQPAALRQASTATTAVTGKLQLNATVPGLSGRASSRPHQSRPEAR